MNGTSYVYLGFDYTLILYFVTWELHCQCTCKHSACTCSENHQINSLDRRKSATNCLKWQISWSPTHSTRFLCFPTAMCTAFCGEQPFWSQSVKCTVTALFSPTISQRDPEWNY